MHFIGILFIFIQICFAYKAQFICNNSLCDYWGAEKEIEVMYWGGKLNVDKCHIEGNTEIQCCCKPEYEKIPCKTDKDCKNSQYCNTYYTPSYCSSRQ